MNPGFCCVRFSFFSIPSQEIGLGKRLRNDPIFVDWDVKPQLSQSVNLPLLQAVELHCHLAGLISRPAHCGRLS